MERVEISFHGYDHTPQELFEIPEVRNFVYQLDEQFPFWLFFLSKRHLGLQCLLFCFLPPFLTEDARSRIFPERIGFPIVMAKFCTLGRAPLRCGSEVTPAERSLALLPVVWSPLSA